MKKLTMALLMATAIMASGAVLAQTTKAVSKQAEVITKETKVMEAIDEAAMQKAKKLYAEADKLSAEIKAKQKKVDALLVQAADMETSAHKLGKKTMRGSHEGYATIKKQYKNCTNCRTENKKDGACKRVKGAHKHYYCFCD